MESRNHRIDRFIAKAVGISRREVRLLIAQKRIWINHQPAHGISQIIGQFDHIRLDEQILQQHTPIYLMMHKPVGVISATYDETQQTVFNLLNEPYKNLHIVGRLDKNTSGLLLLTNDGEWSRRINAPESKIAKHYRVGLGNPMTTEYRKVFAEGMYFPYEDITTQPAKLTQLNEYEAEVVLTEGKYHQIKRMFGRFRNPVKKLHRFAIGELILDPQLQPGDYRPLSPQEHALLC